MDLNEILQKAAAMDELLKEASYEADNSADRAVEEVIEKAAAFDELVASGLHNNNHQSTVDDAVVQDILEKAAAHDEIVRHQAAELEADVLLEKSAAYDELMGTHGYFSNDPEEQANIVMYKAASFDDLVAEAEAEILLEKAAAFEEFMEKANLYDDLLRGN